MPLDSLQRPLHDLRLSIIDACNFRCTYCMPEEKFPELHPFLTRRERLSADELVRLARLATELGARKIRITGGEPLLRHDVTEIVARLAALPGVEDLALITNGHHLARVATDLKAAGLHRLTVSLDALDEPTFRAINGSRAELAPVLAGIAAAEAAGFGPIKLNAVVLRGINDDAIVPLAHFARERGHIMRFIEYMDVGTLNSWGPEQVVSGAEIVARIDAAMPLRPVEAGYFGEVAARHVYADATPAELASGAGEVGVITSVSKPFCGSCTRARIAANGMFYTCLFAKTGVDLRTPLRAGADDAALLYLLAGTWRARADRYSELRQAAAAAATRLGGSAKVEMYHVGG